MEIGLILIAILLGICIYEMYRANKYLDALSNRYRELSEAFAEFYSNNVDKLGDVNRSLYDIKQTIDLLGEPTKYNDEGAPVEEKKDVT